MPVKTEFEICIKCNKSHYLIAYEHSGQSPIAVGQVYFCGIIEPVFGQGEYYRGLVGSHVKGIIENTPKIVPEGCPYILEFTVNAE